MATATLHAKEYGSSLLLKFGWSLVKRDQLMHFAASIKLCIISEYADTRLVESFSFLDLLIALDCQIILWMDSDSL